MSMPPGDPPTVLIVEDEALIAMLLGDTLAEAGYRAVWAPDGCTEHATTAAAAVVDLRLADGLDGRAIVRRLRERRPMLPVMVVTGLDWRAPDGDLRGLGGPTVRLAKPLDLEALLDGLAAMLDGRAAEPMPLRRASDAAVSI